MAYSLFAQTDHGADADPHSVTTPYEELTLAAAPSPALPASTFPALSLDFDSIPGHVTVDEPSHFEASKVTKFLTSLTSSSAHSYDLVEEEEEDYEDLQQTPKVELNRKEMLITMPDAHANHEFHHEFQTMEGGIPVRTASINRKLPLNHPRPDLQSIQGAYVKNVERLEESAERLSMTSSLEGELQKMKMEQRMRERKPSSASHRSGLSRQLSTTSLSNSIIDVNATARSGGYSPSGYIVSPVGSIRSPRPVNERQASKGSKLSHTLREPELEGRPLDLGTQLHIPFAEREFNLDDEPSRPASSSHGGRPGSAGSMDTYQQAKVLFADFDGVHYNPDVNLRASRQISLGRPPRARDSRAFREPQPGEEMIFYPAPVPVMLNLPVRLSKANWSDREKRRLQALSQVPDDMRKSAPWLANEQGIESRNRKSIANLPAHLRASAFFDQPGTTQDVQLKDGSAVATLDSILDAAAHAPVSAFTDHPIAGHLGTEVYGSSEIVRKSVQPLNASKQKRKSSMSNLLKRKSTGDLSNAIHEGRSSPTDGEERDDDKTSADELDRDDRKSRLSDGLEYQRHDDEDIASRHESESMPVEDPHEPGFSLAPTTLLAELQMRKAQQKKRNRTAADAFPNGMHSTLLELDTVTQLQQRARKQKHVTLAWEDKVAADRDNYDDEDIPLGVLFPEKEQENHVNLHRPMGLMEKKEMEENEPLSMRRARLRGEPSIVPGARSTVVPSQIGEPAPAIDLPRLDEDVDGDEDVEETLAQRMKRIRELKEKGTSGVFAQELSSELGLKVDDPNPATSTTPDVEETLGQRRKRLKEEALRNGGQQIASRPGLATKRSMADILQANPIGYQHPNEKNTATVAMQSYQESLRRDLGYQAAQQATAPSPYFQATLPNGYPNASAMYMQPYMGLGYQNQAQSYTNGIATTPMMNYGMSTSMRMGMNSTAYTPGMEAYGQDPFGMGPPLDPKQRATIDRWRQGIM